MIRKENMLFNTFNNIFFVLTSIIVIYPIWYILMFSFSDPSKTSINGLYLIPDGFTLNTYAMVLKEHLILTGYRSSIFVTVIGTAVSLFFTSTTAYPLSRKDLIGKKYFFGFIIFTMLFHGGIIPTYLVVRSVGLTNTLWALILPYTINVYNMLIMIKFYKNIPVSLIEAARIDGYNEFAILLKIILPLSMAALAAVGLFYAVAYWNAFLPGMMYLSDRNKWPLQVVLMDLLKRAETVSKSGGNLAIAPENFKMTTIVITVLPIALLYPFLQKYFMSGVTLGSVKE